MPKEKEESGRWAWKSAAFLAIALEAMVGAFTGHVYFALIIVIITALATYEGDNNDDD
jgi:hypothetical protein